ncbi:hypothetical protein [Shimia biformata]|uniref:hypothetical protein n=1 Tax=Shimia biformata TaxID=1294299 RepID=UPI0019524112|nr:hypothetical protein [Shimia biformata]
MIWRVLGPCLLVWLLAQSGAADERPRGLMWNRSGLAATLPLQVMTDAGADYLLHLHHPDTRQPVFAAYIRGGTFFLVLVPPGRYELAFATGPAWQDESTLFGPDTRFFVIDPPLEFRATMTRRNGHLIDLRTTSTQAVSDFSTCQRFALDHRSLQPETPADLTSPPDLRTSPRLPDAPLVPRYDLHAWVCD